MFSEEDLGDSRKHSMDSSRSEPTEPKRIKPEDTLELPLIERGQIYLIEEDKPDAVYHLFSEKLKEGMPGLCVTRVYPGILGQRFDIRGATIIWLSNAGKEDSIRPRDLERLSLLLQQFLSERKGIVLMDGIEYLITNNDFVTVLRLIQSTRDEVAMNKAIMMLSLNPSTLGGQELSLLEREMDYVVRLFSGRERSHDFHVR